MEVFIFMLCPSELAFLVNLISISIAEGKTNNELNTLSVVFSQIADTLATIVVQREIIEECCEEKCCEKEDNTYETEPINPTTSL